MTVFLLLGICALVLFVLRLPFGRQDRVDPRIHPAAPADARFREAPESIPVATQAAGVAASDIVPSTLDELPAAALLADEKDRLFQALADLRFDFEAGKLSREDFEEEDARLRERAAWVLRELSSGLAPRSSLQHPAGP